MARGGDGAVCREARWFVAGDVPKELRPEGRARSRVDAYHRASLLPWSAVKRRGRAVLEHKVRVGRVEAVDVAGVVGFAETWAKRRRPDVELDRGWLEVRKRMWSFREVEVALVEVDGERAWTVCVDVERTPSAAGRAVLGEWCPVLLARGEPGSYPSWLSAVSAATV